MSIRKEAQERERVRQKKIQLFGEFIQAHRQEDERTSALRKALGGGDPLEGRRTAKTLFDRLQEGISVGELWLAIPKETRRILEDLLLESASENLPQ
jgi:hypothetical protein